MELNGRQKLIAFTRFGCQLVYKNVLRLFPLRQVSSERINVYYGNRIRISQPQYLLESRVADSYNLLSTLVILDFDKKQKKWKSRHDCLYVHLKENVSNMLTRSKTIVLYCKNCLPRNESKFSDSIFIKYQSSLSFIDNMPLNEMKVSTALFYFQRKYFALTLTETSGNSRA